MISFQWQGLSVQLDDQGALRFNGQTSADAVALQALGDVLVAMGKLAAQGAAGQLHNANGSQLSTSSPGVSQPVAAAPTPPAASLTPSPAAFNALTKPGPDQTSRWLASGGAAQTAATPESNDSPTSRPLLPSGEVVKPGPKQLAAFLADGGQERASTSAPAVAAPVAATKPGPAQTAEFLSAENTPVPGSTEPAQAAGDAPVQRSPRGQLLREMQRWLGERGAPATVKELVAAAEAERWSLAANVEPSIQSTLRKRADIFLRNPDGTFALRAARAPARVVRRRPGKQFDR